MRCDSYDTVRIDADIEKLARAVPLGRSHHGKRVLLKPNLISTGGGPLSCTHPRIIGAVAAWYKDHGARVVVGDSPAFGSAVRVCSTFGILPLLKKLDVPVINFDARVQQDLPCGVTLPVSREVLECDLFVGLPKIKAHNQMYVTMAMKNIFGIVTGMNKAMLHMVHGSDHGRFAEIILDLQGLLPEQVHLADGIEVMHVSGPLDGECLRLNCLAAASSPVALDLAMHELLELDGEKSPLLRAARDKGYPGSKTDEVHYPLETPDCFHGSGFSAPDELNPIRFNPFRFLRGSIRRALLRLTC